jgi:Dehydratase family
LVLRLVHQATPIGALPAQLRRRPPGPAMSAQRRTPARPLRAKSGHCLATCYPACGLRAHHGGKQKGCGHRGGRYDWIQLGKPRTDKIAPRRQSELKLNQQLNRRSHVITEGDTGAPRRAQLRAVNFKDGDWDKPIVGVLNLHSTMNPCNAGIQPLVDCAVAELEAIGAKPQTIGGPTGSDAIGMGTEGMRFSLPSREAISRSYQIGMGSHQMDGGLCIAGCDKNKPGAIIGMLFANVPAIYIDAGTIKPGKWKGDDKDIASAFQSVGEVNAGRISREDFEGIERNACPGVGVCGGQYTANTMACAIAALGLSLIDSPLMAAEDQEKLDSVAKSAHILKNAIKMDLKPATSSRESPFGMRSRRSWRLKARPTRYCTFLPLRKLLGSSGRWTTSRSSGGRSPFCAT